VIRVSISLPAGCSGQPEDQSLTGLTLRTLREITSRKVAKTAKKNLKHHQLREISRSALIFWYRI
jgi:hypothetical protein